MTEAEIAKDVVSLFRKQCKWEGSVTLLSCKIALPKCNADEVVKYIEDNYPEYKAHVKKGGGKVTAIAIGCR